MFAKGCTIYSIYFFNLEKNNQRFLAGAKRNVMTHTYLSENEQFTGHDAYKLDEWVFERFERFIKAAPHNHTVKAMLNETQIVFFLHLLGLDTNGHTNKPHSS